MEVWGPLTNTSDPVKAKKTLENWLSTGGYAPQAQKEWQKVYDQYFGQAQQPAFDSAALMDAVYKTHAIGAHEFLDLDAQQAQAALAKKIHDVHALGNDKQAEDLQDVYDHFFGPGGSQYVPPGTLAPEDQAAIKAQIPDEATIKQTIKEGLDKLCALLRTYFDMGGLQVQLSLVDTDQLREAQVHPEQHRDLMVRITGYSAAFVDMTKTAQDEIIRREEMGH